EGLSVEPGLATNGLPLELEIAPITQPGKETVALDEDILGHGHIDQAEAVEASSTALNPDKRQHSIAYRLVSEKRQAKKPHRARHANLATNKSVSIKSINPQTAVLVRIETKPAANFAANASISNHKILTSAIKELNKNNLSSAIEIESRIELAIKEDLEFTEISVKEKPAPEQSPNFEKKVIDFINQLLKMESEEKLLVLKGLTPQKLEALKEILNAHNISLRAFIKA
ncbi:MAG: hypothetical protein QGF46_07905, partial [Planctomycetota bacterium]|nr:hypothetical protein [Planctomycetota bacterium]